MTTEPRDATVTTTCGYCGVGCRLEAHRRGDAIVSITPALDGPANLGHTCLKGRFAHRFARHRQRLTSPLVRDDDGFRAVSWDEALDRVVTCLRDIRARHGADAIAGLASSRATNEDCYVMQRFMRAAIGTHNIDNCSRVCHSPTSFALRRSMGLSGATGSFADIDAAGAALLIGANPTEAHPVAGARLKQATLRGLQLVTIDPRRIELADYAVLHLSPRPGTNAALMLGLAHVIERDGLVDHGFLRDRAEGWDELAALLGDYDPAEVQRITGVPAADLETAAHIYAEAADACVLWGLGVTEHRYGSEVVGLIANLALMCGKVGRPGSALLPLRGQNNVQGSSDMGALPDTFTGYQPVGDEDVAQRFERRWGVAMSREPGLTIPQMFDAAVAGDLKAMYIFGEDVAQTDPDTAHVTAALESLELLVCQDIFENETTRFADVILPASAFLEKHGTFTNAERRIQLVSAALPPPGEARTDFDIITSLSRAMGHDMGFDGPEDAMREIAALTPDFAGVTYERLGRHGLQWPVAADGTDAPILYRDSFPLPGGRARLTVLPYKPPGSEASDRFPLILVTGRRLVHYNAGTMTRRTGNLELMDHDRLEIHPDDAERLWIEDGQLVSVRSPFGRIELPATVTERIVPGHVFTAFHFPEVRTNRLIGPSADVNTSCPEYKVMAVDVRPVAEQPSFTPVLTPH
jgi:formate dehydrogenase major subunit